MSVCLIRSLNALGGLQAHVAHAHSTRLSDEGLATALLYAIASGRPLFDATGEIVLLRQG